VGQREKPEKMNIEHRTFKIERRMELKRIQGSKGSRGQGKTNSGMLEFGKRKEL
jgi:hypothetical protein